MVTYRSAGVVGSSLLALRPGHESGVLRVVVVDNQSSDGTADLVAREHPWVRLVRSPVNLGYGRGCNRGFEEVATPYVLFMNPDVVVSPTAVTGLVRFLEEHPRAGMAAPATRLGGRFWQHAGGLATPGVVVARAAGFRGRHRAIQPGDSPFRTDWLCGAVFLVPSDLFRSLGGFDPRFFLYFEETDLCLRIRKAGRELWGIGEVEATHVGGASARTKDPQLREGDCLAEFFFPSRYYYLLKHFGGPAAEIAEGLELVLKGIRDVGRFVLRRSSRQELRTRLRGPVFTLPPRPS
jgi:GT2 family glycosyltransferase